MFIFLKTDAFANSIQSARSTDEGLSDIHTQGLAVRRPYRGIQIKDDTFSTLSIRHPNGRPIKLISSAQRGDNRNPASGTGQVIEYADYILQSIQEQRMEKQQIIETFGDPYVYFFGERPRIVQFSGQLISSEDFNWRSQFWKNYDENIRGTKLVQNNARAYISFDTIVVEGYVLTASAVDNAENPYTIPFNLSLLVTNYYDWSHIGQTLFPDGMGANDKYKDVETLNKELLKERGKFVSTGAEVRLKNLKAAGASGILAAMRKGIRAVNEAVGMVSNLVGAVHNIIGGRVVRVPIGIAGYLQSSGAATVAGGSVGSEGEAAFSVFDAATGTYKSINGSVKLRAPSSSVYAPSWISAVTKQARGYIWENYDEYPLLKEPEKITELVSPEAAWDIKSRAAHRHLKVEENEYELSIYNQGASAGGFLSDLASAVSFVKSNFGMIMSAAAFVKDPSSVLKQSLGVGVGTTSQSRIAGRSNQLSTMGIKTSMQEEQNQSLLERAGKWIGGSAVRTFKAVATGKVENPQPSSIGEVYNQSAYQQQAVAGAQSGEFAYEPAYGTNNYSSLITTNPDSKEVLDGAFGNVDVNTGSDVQPESLDAVYGTGSSSSSVRSPKEIAAALAAAQSTQTENDEDTAGITGEDDVNAAIDPIV